MTTNFQTVGSNQGIWTFVFGSTDYSTSTKVYQYIDAYNFDKAIFHLLISSSPYYANIDVAAFYKTTYSSYIGTDVYGTLTIKSSSSSTSSLYVATVGTVNLNLDGSGGTIMVYNRQYWDQYSIGVYRQSESFNNSFYY